jgi:hypothetical protein
MQYARNSHFEVVCQGHEVDSHLTLTAMRFVLLLSCRGTHLSMIEVTANYYVYICVLLSQHCCDYMYTHM